MTDQMIELNLEECEVVAGGSGYIGTGTRSGYIGTGTRSEEEGAAGAIATSVS